MTSTVDGSDHLLSTPAASVGLVAGHGTSVALCGRLVLAAPLTVPPGPTCFDCETALHRFAVHHGRDHVRDRGRCHRAAAAEVASPVLARRVDVRGRVYGRANASWLARGRILCPQIDRQFSPLLWGFTERVNDGDHHPSSNMPLTWRVARRVRSYVS
ncbi:MAG: hypothetical protein ACRDTC_00265 [Pseudonocardiaceae bacterium]